MNTANIWGVYVGHKIYKQEKFDTNLALELSGNQGVTFVLTVYLKDDMKMFAVYRKIVDWETINKMRGFSFFISFLNDSLAGINQLLGGRVGD